MKFDEYKFEFTIIFIIISVIVGVIIWFTLDFFSISNSIELAIISTVTLIMILITNSLHGKGLLPEPKDQRMTNKLIYNYTRGKIRESPFKRKKYLGICIRKKKYR